MIDYTDQTEMINALYEDVSEALALVRERETRINELVARNKELLAKRDEWETIAKYKAKIIEKMESEQREIMRELPTWISVEERLPETGKVVLLCINCEKSRPHTGFLTVDGEFMHDVLGDMSHSKWKVTHWMLLPEPPKEVE